MLMDDVGGRRRAAALAPGLPGRFRTGLTFVRPGIRRRIDLLPDGLPEDVGQALADCHEGADVWILGTYLRLRRRGFDVELADDFRPGALCVAHRDDVLLRAPVLWRSFVVAVRADRERAFTCDLEMVQSPSSIEGRKGAYVLHWPQPGLRPRDPARGATLARLGYFGRMKNLAAEYRSAPFIAELASLGMEMIIREDPCDWSNYSDVDAVLAVRDGSPRFLASKPATKLFNAWHARCLPFVGGEPAFQYHQRSELDFIKVGSARELLDHLRWLRANPARYQRFLSHAEVRAKEVTEDRVVENWCRFFNEVAIPGYERWRERPAPARHGRSLAALGWNLFRTGLRGNSYSRGYDLDGNALADKRSAPRRLAARLDAFLTARERQPCR